MSTTRYFTMSGIAGGLVRIDLDPANRLAETLRNGVWLARRSLLHIVLLGDIEWDEVDRDAAVALLTAQGLDAALLDAPAAAAEPASGWVGVSADFYDADGNAVDVSDRRAMRGVIVTRDPDGVEHTLETRRPDRAGP